MRAVATRRAILGGLTALPAIGGSAALASSSPAASLAGESPAFIKALTEYDRREKADRAYADQIDLDTGSDEEFDALQVLNEDRRRAAAALSIIPAATLAGLMAKAARVIQCQEDAGTLLNDALSD